MKFDDGCSMPYDDDRSITNGQYDEIDCDGNDKWTVQFFRFCNVTL